MTDFGNWDVKLQQLHDTYAKFDDDVKFDSQQVNHPRLKSRACDESCGPN